MNYKSEFVGTVRLALAAVGVEDNASHHMSISNRVLDLAWEEDWGGAVESEVTLLLTEKVKANWPEYRDRVLGRRTLSITLSLPKGGVSLTASTETAPSLVDVAWAELWKDIKSGLTLWAPGAVAASDAAGSAAAAPASGSVPVPPPSEEKIPAPTTEKMTLKEGAFMVTVDSSGKKLRAFYHPYDKFGVTVYREVADAMLPDWEKLEPGVKVASTRPIVIAVSVADGKRKPLKVTGWGE